MCRSSGSRLPAAAVERPPNLAKCALDVIFSLPVLSSRQRGVFRGPAIPSFSHAYTSTTAENGIAAGLL
jgi:hypothetical protein